MHLLSVGSSLEITVFLLSNFFFPFEMGSMEFQWLSHHSVLQVNTKDLFFDFFWVASNIMSCMLHRFLCSKNHFIIVSFLLKKMLSKKSPRNTSRWFIKMLEWYELQKIYNTCFMVNGNTALLIWDNSFLLWVSSMIIYGNSKKLSIFL